MLKPAFAYLGFHKRSERDLLALVAQQREAMPVTKVSTGLCVVGAGLVAACRLAWAKKATNPFRFAYFFSWPTLGTGLILMAQPENENMVEVSHGDCTPCSRRCRSLRRSASL